MYVDESWTWTKRRGNVLAYRAGAESVAAGTAARDTSPATRRAAPPNAHRILRGCRTVFFAFFYFYVSRPRTANSIISFVDHDIGVHTCSMYSRTHVGAYAMTQVDVHDSSAGAVDPEPDTTASNRCPRSVPPPSVVESAPCVLGKGCQTRRTGRARRPSAGTREDDEWRLRRLV